MKKNGLKKLTVMLFAMMLFTLCAVSTNVQAASKITLENGSEAPETLYVGQTYNLSVDGTIVRFYSRNKSVATIGMKTGVLKTVAPGTVEIIARSEESGKIVAKCSFTVNQRATSVTTESNSLYLSKDEKTVIKASLLPENSTDVIRFTTSDETVVTVDQETGEVVGKKNGSATITVYAMDTTETDYSSSENKVAKINVSVDDYMKEVHQIEINKLVVTFGYDISQVTMKESDFTVKGKTDTYPVQKIEMDKKNNKVTLTTYSNFTDGGTYSVFYKKKSAEFKATDSKVARIEVSPTVVSCEDEIPVYLVLYDENEVLLERKPLVNGYNIDAQVIIKDGYMNKNILCLSNPDSNADISVTYRTNVYKNGVEAGNIKLTNVQISAMSKDETVESGLTYTIANKDENAHFETADYKQNKVIAIGDESYNIYFYIANSVGKEYVRYEDYVIKSSNANILKLSEELTNVSKKLKLTPVKEGTVDLVVTNKATQKVITKIPITVQPKRVATTISIEKTDYTARISKTKKESESFTIHVLDQYGVELDRENGLLTTQIKVSDASKVKDGCAISQRLSISSNKVTIYTADSPKATYTYKIQYMKLAPVYFKVTYKG